MTTIRALTDADREGAHRVRLRAFSSDLSGDEGPRDEDDVEDGRRLVAVDGDEVVGHLATWGHAQWFGGRAVPCGGVASVAVEPSHRGQGVATALMTRALDDMRDRGDALSMLYPMTWGVYRRHGYEIAGLLVERHLPTRSLAALPRPTRPSRLRTTTPGDLDAMGALHEEVSRPHPGTLRRGTRFRDRRLRPRDTAVGYVAERGGAIVGYVSYGHAETAEAGSSYDVVVRELVGIDADAELALWHLVGSNASAAATTRLVSRPDDPLLTWLPDANDLRPAAFEHRWMSRLVDLPAAITGRGYPRGVSGAVALQVCDPVLGANDGAWVLEVADGSATLTPGETGAAAIDIGALASLYTGFVSPWTLARAGRIVGPSEDDLATLAAVFGGPTPWAGSYF